MRKDLLFVVSVIGLTSSCYDQHCDELKRNAIEGRYASEANRSEPWLLGSNVALQASSDKVELVYTRADGVRIRAIYRVTKKGSAW